MASVACQARWLSSLLLYSLLLPFFVDAVVDVGVVGVVAFAILADDWMIGSGCLRRHLVGL